MALENTGVFGCDDALDYLAEIQSQLLRQIKKVLSEPILAAPDDPNSARIVAAVEIAAVLCERCKAMPPNVDVVKQCRDKFLEVWDENAENIAATPEDKEMRRQVIKNTFDRLLNLSREWNDAK